MTGIRLDALLEIFLILAPRAALPETFSRVCYLEFGHTQSFTPSFFYRNAVLCTFHDPSCGVRTAVITENAPQSSLAPQHTAGPDEKDYEESSKKASRCCSS